MKNKILTIGILLVFSGCSLKSTDKNIVSINDNSTDSNSVSNDSVEVITESEETITYRDYLSDPLIFEEIDNQGITGDHCFLVASDCAKLYPLELFTFDSTSSSADIIDETKMEGTPIPLGTLLQPTDNLTPVMSTTGLDVWGIHYDLFNFENNYNYFYQVIYDGKEGLVFGADLLPISKKSSSLSTNIDRNKIIGELLVKNGILDKFRAYENLDAMNPTIKDSIEADRLAMMQYQKRYVTTDDLIDSYSEMRDYLPMFITTDLISHSQHLFFDRSFKYIEETILSPRLKDLCSSFIEKISARTDLPEETKKLTLQYFQVPDLILNSIIVTSEKKYMGEGEYKTLIKYSKSDDENFYAQYYPEVVEEYNNIMSATGDKSAIFQTAEMFSQYEPGEHYKNNMILENYFRARKWFENINFVIAQDEGNPEKNEYLEKMAPVAIVICDTVQKNPDLYKGWQLVFDIMTDIFGASENPVFYEIIPLWEKQNVENLSDWLADKTKLYKFVNLCYQKLNPAVTGVSSVSEDGNERNPSMSWSFLGQRNTYDSTIFTQVSAPKLSSRELVRGLDVIKVVGSEPADVLLAQEGDYSDEQVETNPYSGGSEFKEVTDKLLNQFNSYDNTFFAKNYYNTILGIIQAQAKFNNGAGFYYTESPMWNIKSLISAHSTLAEFHHESTGYTDFQYAEGGHEISLDPTYRTKEIPKPINHIEANIDFWNKSIESLELLQSVYKKHDLLDDEFKRTISDLLYIYKRSVEIVMKESRDKEITSDENEFIRRIPDRLSEIVMIHNINNSSYGSYQVSNELLEMSCIADVFTNPEREICLEVGIGQPVKVYIPLNDISGKRIAVGFIPSYYEFEQDYNTRLNKDEWKKKVYSSDFNHNDYMPFWEKECILSSQK